MFKFRSMLNYLVIGIMAFMIALTALFIYTSVHMKNKITFRIVQQTELLSDLIARSALNVMSTGHSDGQYEMILQYGNMIGIDDIGVYRPDGTEAFGGMPVLSGTKSEVPVSVRSITQEEKASFRRAVKASNPAGFFDSNSMTYSRYVPLRSEPGCRGCHRKANELLGVMKIRLSTEHDLELLNYIRKLIWSLGLIVCLPVGALLVAGAIIKEKNKLYFQLKESNANIKKTYNELDETKYYLQMILDNSRVIIVTTDTTGRIVEFNKEAEQLLGYSKAEVVGKDVLMIYDSPQQRSMLMNRGRPIDDSVWEVRNRDVTLRSKSGKVYHVTFTLSTMVNDMGRIIGTVGIGKDISEQKMLQFKLLQSEKLAGIGTLASGIAHEINNPLAGILGMAEAIRDEDDMGLIRSYTGDIIEYTTNAKNIVRELSAYSRSVQNEAQATMDLTAIILNSLKMTRHSASFVDIDITEDLHEGSFINANPVEIQQVFVNLMLNAIHAMGERGSLTLKCATEGTEVKATVADTGHGIPEANLSQIFDPFFTTKPVGMGTGLGLYVAYRIVTKYRGQIDVESREGVGTMFTLRFPLAEAPSEEDSDRI